MPIYEYRCDRGHTFEVLQRMTDDPVTVCTSCEAAVQRVMHPVAVHFKGSGFYTTDYGKRSRDGAGESSDSAKAASDKDDSAATTDKSESKSESKSGSSKSGSSKSGSGAKAGSQD
jgi:putative FmdB family regulatory protein